MLASEGCDAASLHECPPTDVAGSALDVALPKPDEAIASEQHVLAPPPDTVVVGAYRDAFRAEERLRAGEVLQYMEHATQVARLTQTLRDIGQVHAAEIERLRAQHASEIRRLVEALWHAQDAARAAATLPERAAVLTPAPRPGQVARGPMWVAFAVSRMERSRHSIPALSAHAAHLWSRICRAWVYVARGSERDHQAAMLSVVIYDMSGYCWRSPEPTAPFVRVMGRVHRPLVSNVG